MTDLEIRLNEILKGVEDEKQGTLSSITKSIKEYFLEQYDLELTEANIKIHSGILCLSLPKCEIIEGEFNDDLIGREGILFKEWRVSNWGTTYTFNNFDKALYKSRKLYYQKVDREEHWRRLQELTEEKRLSLVDRIKEMFCS